MTDKIAFIVTEDGGREIPLEVPITGHNGPIARIHMRAPTFNDFIEIGDPTMLIVAPHAAVPHDDLDIIKKYILRLSNIDELILRQTTLRDAILMCDAVKDFFQTASGSTSKRSGIS